MRNFSMLPLPNIVTITESRIMRLGERVAGMVDNRNEYRDLVGKSKGKRPHRRPSF